MGIFTSLKKLNEKMINKFQFSPSNLFPVLTILIFICHIQLASSQCNKDMFFYGGKVIEYIASEEFDKSLQSHSPHLIVDSIFKYALSLADGDIADALLFCSVGTIPYTDFEMKFPLIGFPIKVFIFNIVDRDMFEKMIQHLPAKLFSDSPEGKFGDKDKLTHFFSSAFWAYTFNGNVSNALGYFVENFEEGFKVQSKIDERDLMFNKLGIEFGLQLREYVPSQRDSFGAGKEKFLFPSDILSKIKNLGNG